MSEIKKLPPRPAPPPRPQKPMEDFSADEKLDEVKLNDDIKDIEEVQTSIETVEENTSDELKQLKQKEIQHKKLGKTKKNKKKKINKKIIIIILCSCLILSFLIVVGSLFIVNYLQINKKLELVDKNLSVYEYSEKVYLKAPEHDCNKYIFEIFDGEFTSLTKSKNSLFEITDFIEIGKEYVFKFYIEGLTEKSRSDCSISVEYMKTQLLQTPQIRLSQDKQGIVWDKITNATSYSVYYFNNLTSKVVIDNISSSDDVITYTPDLLPGNYVFHVLSKSSQNGYLPSLISNPININILDVEKSPSKIIVNREDATVTIEVDNLFNIPVFVICIGSEKFCYNATEIKQVYQVNFKTIMEKINLGEQVSVYIQARNEKFENSPVCYE